MKTTTEHFLPAALALAAVALCVTGWGYIQKARADLALVAAMAERERREAAKKAPVVTGMTATDWQVVDGRWSALVVGRKLRDECRPTRHPWVGIARNRVSGEFVLRFLDDDTPESARPSGKQSFDRWAFEGDVQHGDDLAISAIHACTGSDQGEYPVTTIIEMTVGAP